MNSKHNYIAFFATNIRVIYFALVDNKVIVNYFLEY